MSYEKKVQQLREANRFREERRKEAKARASKAGRAAQGLPALGPGAGVECPPTWKGLPLKDWQEGKEGKYVSSEEKRQEKRSLRARLRGLLRRPAP